MSTKRKSEEKEENVYAAVEKNSKIEQSLRELLKGIIYRGGRLLIKSKASRYIFKSGAKQTKDRLGDDHIRPSIPCVFRQKA